MRSIATIAPAHIAGSHVVFRSQIVPESKAQLSMASSPLLYGLAVYSVLHLSYDSDRGKYIVFRLSDHLRRLHDSAMIVGMTLEDGLLDEQSFTRQLGTLIKRNDLSGDVLIRVSLFTDEILTGTKTHGLKTSLSMYAYRSPHFYPPAGIAACISSWRRTPDNCIPSRAKINGSYINASLIKNQALRDGYDDALALDMSGHVAESTVANVFLVRNGQLITPDPSADILEGITRDTVIKWATSNGLDVVQRPVDASELYIADEVFLTGTSAKITPVLSVDRRPVHGGSIGPITHQLQHDYNDMLAGQLVIKPSWLTVV